MGFTLVELMISIVVASLLTVAFYSTYVLQRRSHTVQGQVAEMQQNVRAGVQAMIRDIRMAGFDPELTAYLGGGTPRITAARPDLFAFSADLDESGDLRTVDPGATNVESEYFAFDLYSSASGVSSLGYASSTFEPIVITNKGSGHYEATNHQPVADNIERLEFAYVLDDGTLTGNVTSSGDLDEIRQVRVSILARAKTADPKYTNTNTYTTALGTPWTGFNDGFRRRLIITQIDLRNMGL